MKIFTEKPALSIEGRTESLFIKHIYNEDITAVVKFVQAKYKFSGMS